MQLTKLIHFKTLTSSLLSWFSIHNFFSERSRDPVITLGIKRTFISFLLICLLHCAQIKYLYICSTLDVFLCFLKGFDNNGVKTGPRSTRQSNPEEHASQYFNTFSKDMLVQVGFMHFKLTANTGHEWKMLSLVYKISLTLYLANLPPCLAGILYPL